MRILGAFQRIALRFRKLLLIGAAGIVAGAGLLGWTYDVVGSAAARTAIYTSPQACPAHAIAILFGCGKYVAGGRLNQYYLHRIRAAADLYQAGKARHILISGDNHIHTYNEPESMQQDLLATGVPASAMTLDYAGFSTFETLIRANRIFGVRSAIVITQPFHLPRALYIADAVGIQAVGYAAREPNRSLRTLKTEVREILARFATFGDLRLWHRQPRFLGPREPILITPELP